MSAKLAFAIFVSILLHGLLVIGSVWGWEHTQQKKPVQIPNYVEAKLVKLKAESKKKSKPKKSKVIDLQAKRKEQERLKREAEKKRQAALAKKREKEKREKEKEAERKKREEEQKRKAAEEKERQRQATLDKDFEEMLLEEENLLLEQEFANEAQSYIALIQKRVSNKFVPPPSARKGMQTKVAIALVPTGRIVSATIVKGSGNEAFDRAARQAVLDVEEFKEVKEMPSPVFERYFRNFSINVNPQGLRL